MSTPFRAEAAISTCLQAGNQGHIFLFAESRARSAPKNVKTTISSLKAHYSGSRPKVKFGMIIFSSVLHTLAEAEIMYPYKLLECYGQGSR